MLLLRLRDGDPSGGRDVMNESEARLALAKAEFLAYELSLEIMRANNWMGPGNDRQAAKKSLAKIELLRADLDDKINSVKDMMDSSE